MNAALASQWQQARNEWNANPRLRWGALAIAVILFLYLCMLLVEWRADLQQRYQQRSLQLYKVAALTGQDQWLLRAESASTVQKALTVNQAIQLYHDMLARRTRPAGSVAAGYRGWNRRPAPGRR